MIPLNKKTTLTVNFIAAALIVASTQTNAPSQVVSAVSNYLDHQCISAEPLNPTAFFKVHAQYSSNVAGCGNDLSQKDLAQYSLGVFAVLTGVVKLKQPSNLTH